MSKNFKEKDPESDIVISSRVRMARNIESVSFPHYLDKEEAKNVIDRVYDTITKGHLCIQNEFKLIKMDEIDLIERSNYVEKHLISPALAKNVSGGAFLINNEETISIMINEEDHIRIQCLYPGLQLERCFDMADKIDDLLEEGIVYAFDEQLGYLACCPTNIGTGVRTSVMLHLPALSLTGYINGVISTAGKIGLAVRGIFGEGTEYLGDIYQISNQITLGMSEEEIINNLKDVSLQIIQNERIAWERLLDNKGIELEDRVFRSYGTLKNARLLSSKEAMQLISDVKLGVNLKLIDGISTERLNELITMIQPGYLQKHFKSQLTGVERDIKRAQLVRENILQ
ncbi:MAG: protein arginine kinase [Natronincolaceae bacterium]|jgi:protein arginine kinase|nr:protein arginine kinase [Bacillota bacterium]NLK90413.1 protein arginine kinase [Clostridiales bacterium]